jgi:hypothetical protein
MPIRLTGGERTARVVVEHAPVDATGDRPRMSVE